MGGADDDLHDDLHGLLLELVRSMGDLVSTDEDGGARTAVTMSEALTLHELDSDVVLSQQELADRLRLDKSTVSRLVAGLEGRGLIRRHRDPANRRYVQLILTPTGQQLHRDIGSAMHRRQQRVLGRMTAAERQSLRTGLQALLSALDQGD